MKEHLSKISIIMLLLIVGYGCRKDSPKLITDELAEIKLFMLSTNQVPAVFLKIPLPIGTK